MATFFIQQKITAFANQYRVFEDRSGEPGALLAFAHQKRFSFRERFIFFTDESKASVAFYIQARNILDFGSGYDVEDSAGYPLGFFRKAFKESLLRSTWHVPVPGDEATPLIIAQERSMPVALLRRLWDWVPYIGDAPFFIKYHFDFLDAKTQETVGEYFKTTRFRDHYRLVVEDRYLKTIDWRTFVCLGVVMDALQGR